MPRISHAFRPGENSLEPRFLLSSMRGPAEFKPLLPAGVPRGGTLAGGYVAFDTPHLFDDGVRADINAIGLVRGLGRTRLSGRVVVGFYGATDQNVGGRVTLSTPRGTVSLRLSGHTSNVDVPISGLSFGLTATVEGGSGAYANVRGFGAATLSFESGVTQTDVPLSPSDRRSFLVDHVDVTHGALMVKLNLRMLR